MKDSMRMVAKKWVVLCFPLIVHLHRPLTQSQQSWAAHALALQPYANQLAHQLQLPWGASAPSTSTSSFEAPFNSALQALFSTAVQGLSAALPAPAVPLGGAPTSGTGQATAPGLLQLPAFAPSHLSGILQPPPPLEPLKGPHVPATLQPGVFGLLLCWCDAVA